VRLARSTWANAAIVDGGAHTARVEVEEAEEWLLAFTAGVGEGRRVAPPAEKARGASLLPLPTAALLLERPRVINTCDFFVTEAFLGAFCAEVVLSFRVLFWRPVRGFALGLALCF